MTPKDISGVFSRQFVLGHFLPAFFAIAVGAILASNDALPKAYTTSHGLAAKALALGLVALPLGLLLSGAHAHVVRQFSGEATERMVAEDKIAMGRWARWLHPPIRLHYDFKLARQRKQYDTWSEQAGVRTRDPIAALGFDQRFPANGVGLLPTRLGNAIRASETYADSRYGLDGALIWPRIELLLTAEERAVISDARTDVAFFLNCALMVLPLAGWIVAVHVLGHPRHWPWWLAATPVVAILLFLMFRLGAVTAAYRWGTPTRAAVDLHRLELYDRLGLPRPATDKEELEVANAVNRWLRHRKPPGSMRTTQARPPSG